MLMQFCFKNVHSCLAALLGWIFKLVSGTQVQQTPVGEISRLKTRTKEQKEGSSTQLTTPSSVNYHFTRNNFEMR
uniref:Secreted protein n=1 Tax=Sinocyclocheilus grahami TaxID=75366 RepID=A0A672QDL3_SINGR